MAYIEGSASRPGTWDPAARVVEWHLGAAPVSGITLTFRVLPLETGHLPTNVRATGELVAFDGTATQWTFDVPYVDVLMAEPMGTATPGPTTTPYASPRPTTVTPTPYGAVLPDLRVSHR